MWELLLKLAEFLLGELRPPLLLDVEKFYFQDSSHIFGDQNSIVRIIRAHARCYHAELTLTNRSGRPAYVKSITLKVPGGKVCKPGHLPKALRLESHEFKKQDVVFPLGNNEEPMTGEFKIEITPSVGRKSVKRVRL